LSLLPSAGVLETEASRNAGLPFVNLPEASAIRERTKRGEDEKSSVVEARSGGSDRIPGMSPAGSCVQPYGAESSSPPTVGYTRSTDSSGPPQSSVRFFARNVRSGIHRPRRLRIRRTPSPETRNSLLAVDPPSGFSPRSPQRGIWPVPPAAVFLPPSEAMLPEDERRPGPPDHRQTGNRLSPTAPSGRLSPSPASDPPH
jgi:hypothetical protein